MRYTATGNISSVICWKTSYGFGLRDGKLYDKLKVLLHE